MARSPTLRIVACAGKYTTGHMRRRVDYTYTGLWVDREFSGTAVFPLSLSRDEAGASASQHPFLRITLVMVC